MGNNISNDFTVTVDGVEASDGFGFAENESHIFLTHHVGDEDILIAALRPDGTFDVFRHGYRITGALPTDSFPAKDTLAPARG